MKSLHLRKYMLLSLLTIPLLVWSWEGHATARPIECEGKADMVKVVSAPGVQETTVNYNTPLDGLGHFDPTPLLANQSDSRGARTQLSHRSLQHDGAAD